MAQKDTKLRIIVEAQNNANASLMSVKNNLDAIKSSNEGLITGMKTVGVVGTAVFAGLATATMSFVRAGANFEQTQISFETMIGSATKAKKLLQDIAKFASTTPFQLPQLEEASKRLMAYGVASEEVLPILKTLGDISAGVGMDKLPQLILAFGQVKAVTRLTGMELRQFSEAGVPLLGALAEQFGKTSAEIQEMVSNGEIGFNDVQKALESLTAEGGRFNNLMARQSESLAGLWSNFQDQVSLTARVFGEQLVPVLKPVVENLIILMGIIREWVAENPKLAISLLTVALVFTGLMAILLPLAFVLPMLVAGFTIMATVLGAVLSPAGLLITAILVTLAFTIFNLIKIGYILATSWDEVWLGIKLTVADVVNSVIKLVEVMVNSIITGVNAVIKTINSLIQKLASIPKIGSAFKKLSISEISAVSFAGVNTDDIVNSTLKSSNQPTVNNFTITGNTLLDKDAGVKLGDDIIKQLKLSNAI